MLTRKNHDFSFSVLKTAVLYTLNKLDKPLEDCRPDLCASFQEAVIDVLTKKTIHLAQALGETCITVSGGVSCNSRLREVLKENFNDIHFVEPRYCTDNADMIANLALRASEKALPFPECLEIDAKSRFIEKDQFITK